MSALIRAGHSDIEVAKLVKAHRSTVNRVRKRVQEGETLKQRPGTKKPPKLSPEGAKEAFQKKPTMTMTEFAKKKGVARSTVEIAIRKAGGKSQKYL